MNIQFTKEKKIHLTSISDNYDANIATSAGQHNPEINNSQELLASCKFDKDSSSIDVKESGIEVREEGKRDWYKGDSSESNAHKRKREFIQVSDLGYTQDTGYLAPSHSDISSTSK